jgi:hypothetical protein
MRGIKVGFDEVAPTIPSKRKIHVVGSKIYIQSPVEKMVIKGQLRARTRSRAKLYE